MKNITYLDNDTLPECVYKNKQNILAIIDEIAKTYGLDFKGEYISDETYNKNNVVVYNNKTYVYISVVTTSNILPTNTAFWALWIDPKPGAQGEKGEPGEKGGEVESVVKVSTVENVDTYRMTFSNGYTSEFTVTNGKDGQNGQNGQNGKGIESISLVSSTESSSTYRINYGDGLTFDFTVQNGVSPTITIGTVTTVGSTENARVENSGTEKNVVLDFYLPKGEKGEQGNPGVSVNAEVVSEQTESVTDKVYSVAFTNGILDNFTGQISSIYSDLAKKLELSESSAFITGSLSEDKKTLYFNVPLNSGVYALYSYNSIIGIFGTYRNTTVTANNPVTVLHGSNISHDITSSGLDKVRFYEILGKIDENTNLLALTETQIIYDVTNNNWTKSNRDLSIYLYNLVKLA